MLNVLLLDIKHSIAYTPTVATIIKIILYGFVGLIRKVGRKEAELR